MQKKLDTRRTQQERRDEAETRLLVAAMELIAEQGIVKTSLAQIGERAGYSRGLVNYHFRTKDALIERLVEHCQQYYRAEISDISADNGLERLLEASEAYIRLYQTPGKLKPTLLVLWGAALPRTADRDAIIVLEKRIREFAAENIKLGQQDGSIARTVDAKAFAFALVGLLRGVAAEYVLNPDAIGAKRLREEVRSFIRAYLGNTT